MTNWIFWGALISALSVVAGAFGAHALAEKLDPKALALWETASRYAMYGGIALVQVGLYARSGGKLAGAGYCLLIGTAIFSGTVFALALGGPRILGAITPIGGSLMIVGLALFAWAALRTAT